MPHQIVADFARPLGVDEIIALIEHSFNISAVCGKNVKSKLSC